MPAAAAAPRAARGVFLLVLPWSPAPGLWRVLLCLSYALTKLGVELAQLLNNWGILNIGCEV